MTRITAKISYFQRHGYFLARKFLVLAPVALARSLKTRNSSGRVVADCVLRNLAQGDGPSRAIRQQANMRVAKNTNRRNDGFIALFTAIIISVVLIIVSVSLNRGGYLTRGETLDAEYKNRSLALAEACMDIAMLKLANNPGYAGGETDIAVGSDKCDIGAVSAGGFQYTINTGAVFPATSVSGQGAVTNLQVVVNSADFSLVFWQESP